ncbi:hypothetical protein GH714_036561 [Hevea brasiliensis]|uniref:RING-type E3 ubiquitin transferase n=1 Tax=Hevea brasiliensis TaxID=3981 RepID=A0A6A6KGC7_HEVBR|nr:hypothetical protein GH714_036561 [Hevea brasiliensis]
MLSVTFLILAYAKFCHRNTTGVHLLVHDTYHQNFLPLSRSRSRFSGIDRAVIDSLPFFRFSSLKGSKQGLECAVCLSIFEDTEILRLLPKCKHAFHKNCIDRWLESHSSCPLCRYKFDPKDLKSLSFSNSLRYLQNPSNLTEDPNLSLFVQREQDYHGSSRFNLRSNDQGNKQELLLVRENRWSDVNSSDFLSLKSEMLSVMSSNMFSPSNSSSAGFYNSTLSVNENIEKIKGDIERKRLYESKISKVERSDSFSTSSFPSTSYPEENKNWSKMISPAEKRSMSEIQSVQGSKT